MASMEAVDRGRIRYKAFADHYSQARLFYISQIPAEQAAFASALVFELSKVETLLIRQSIVGHLRNINENLVIPVCDCLARKELRPQCRHYGS
jgi:catalase